MSKKKRAEQLIYFRKNTRQLLALVQRTYKDLGLDTKEGDNLFEAISDLTNLNNYPLIREDHELMMQKSLIFLIEYIMQKDIPTRGDALEKLCIFYEDVVQILTD